MGHVLEKCTQVHEKYLSTYLSTNVPMHSSSLTMKNQILILAWLFVCRDQQTASLWLRITNNTKC